MATSETELPEPAFAASSTLAELRARVIERASREPAPTRADLARERRIVTVAMLLVPVLVFLAAGGVRGAPRPDELVLETALGSAFLAAGIAMVGLGRGRSMLGRPRSWLLALILLTPLTLFAWRVIASSEYPQLMAEWVGRPGLRCLLLGNALCLAPLAGLLWLRRGSDPVHPRTTAAGIGCAVGAGSWVLVDLWCPVGYVPHLLVGHVLPLLLVIAVSALVGRRILGLSR